MQYAVALFIFLGLTHLAHATDEVGPDECNSVLESAAPQPKPKLLAFLSGKSIGEGEPTSQTIEWIKETFPEVSFPQLFQTWDIGVLQRHLGAASSVPEGLKFLLGPPMPKKYIHSLRSALTLPTPIVLSWLVRVYSPWLADWHCSPRAVGPAVKAFLKTLYLMRVRYFRDTEVMEGDEEIKNIARSFRPTGAGANIYQRNILAFLGDAEMVSDGIATNNKYLSRAVSGPEVSEISLMLRAFHYLRDPDLRRQALQLTKIALSPRYDVLEGPPALVKDVVQMRQLAVQLIGRIGSLNQPEDVNTLSNLLDYPEGDMRQLAAVGSIWWLVQERGEILPQALKTKILTSSETIARVHFRWSFIAWESDDLPPSADLYGRGIRIMDFNVDRYTSQEDIVKAGAYLVDMAGK